MVYVGEILELKNIRLSQVNCVIDKASLWDVKVGCVLRRVLLKCYWELGKIKSRNPNYLMV